MLVVGLTGGIGSGKSTVAALLAGHGAVILDADAMTHEVQAPGGPAYQPIVDRFGPEILLPDGTLDRPALAKIVFADRAALADLNAIVHPEVGKLMAARLAAEEDSDRVVVLDVPLLVESGRLQTAGNIVVDCPEEIAVRRLVELRGMDEEDVRRRIAAQATRDERRARADYVIVNDGSREQLRERVAAAWAWVQELARTSPAPAG
jgi:dephospho-CoA kinase